MDEAEKLHAAAEDRITDLTDTIEKIRAQDFGFRSRHSFSARVKSSEGIMEKLERKRLKKPNYNVSDITDVIGLRFVVLFKHDIPEIVDTIFRLILDEIGSKEKPYRGQRELGGAKFHEFIQYISLPTFMAEWRFEGARDSLSDSLNDLLEKHDVKDFPSLKIIPVPNYSSVHIVLFIESEFRKERLSIPVEIQVRTVFENAWSEVDHLLFYEEDRKGGAGDSRRAAVSQHLSILKRLMDTATDYAAIIDRDNDTRKMGDGKSLDISIKNLDGIRYVREICTISGFNADYTKEFISIIEKKEELDKKSTVIDGPNSYTLIARELRALIDAWELQIGSGEGFAKVFYLIRMEEALARLLSGQREQIVKAVDLYRSISVDFPDMPTCWFRLGQACMRLAEAQESNEERLPIVDEAIGAYEKLNKTLEFVLGMSESDRFLIISDQQRNLLLNKLPRLQSFASWLRSDLRRRETGHASAEDVKDLQLAIAIGREGLNHVANDEAVHLKSNLLYYLFDLAQCAKLYPELGNVSPPLEDIKSALHSVEFEIEKQSEGVDSDGDFIGWRKLHTLLSVYDFLDENLASLELARKLLLSLGRLDKRRLSPEELELSGRAQIFATNVLFRLACKKE